MMGNFEKNKVLCVHDRNIIAELNKIEHIKNRAMCLFDLIKSYNLFNEMDVVRAIPADYEDLVDFHSTFYIDSIRDIETQQEEDLEEIGLTGDCPVLDDMFSFISHVAGGSLIAAQGLISGKYKFAINWCGGWHHAQRDMAEGFCYVNDIVLAILRLSKQFDRILYIDLDVHHGNGVENAFSSTQKVFTLSLHRNGVGFYPNTGDLNDVGTGKGKYYTANVPFQSGTSDKTYLRVFYSVIKVIRETYQPQCLVVQCGADSLAKDELGDFNVSSEAFGDIISHLVAWSLPSLFLGGGGYNIINSARYWTYLTSIITSTPISSDIPDESEHFMKYGPDFTLPVTSSYGRRDENSEEAVGNIIRTVVNNIARYVTSPCHRIGELTLENEPVEKEIVSQPTFGNKQNFEIKIEENERVQEFEKCDNISKESTVVDRLDRGDSVNVQGVIPSPIDGHNQTDEHSPTDGHSPADGHTSTDEHISIDGYNRTDGHKPTDEYISIDGHNPKDGHIPIDGHISTNGHKPTDGHNPTNGHNPVDVQIPTDGHNQTDGHNATDDELSACATDNDDQMRVHTRQPARLDVTTESCTEQEIERDQASVQIISVSPNEISDDLCETIVTASNRREYDFMHGSSQPSIGNIVPTKVDEPIDTHVLQPREFNTYITEDKGTETVTRNKKVETTNEISDDLFTGLNKVDSGKRKVKVNEFDFENIDDGSAKSPFKYFKKSSDHPVIKLTKVQKEPCKRNSENPMPKEDEFDFTKDEDIPKTTFKHLKKSSDNAEIEKLTKVQKETCKRNSENPMPKEDEFDFAKDEDIPKTTFKHLKKSSDNAEIEKLTKVLKEPCKRNTEKPMPKEDEFDFAKDEDIPKTTFKYFKKSREKAEIKDLTKVHTEPGTITSENPIPKVDKIDFSKDEEDIPRPLFQCFKNLPVNSEVKKLNKVASDYSDITDRPSNMVLSSLEVSGEILANGILNNLKINY